MEQAAKGPAWQRGSGCGNGACVEVAKVDDRFLIRDSKHPDAAVLSFSEAEWDAFTFAIKQGEFRFG